MNGLVFLLLLLLYSDPGLQKSIDPGHLSFEGIPFHAEKALILKTLGQTTKEQVFYKCGFFSEDVQGKAFFELRYPDAIWIGNDTDGYSLDKLFFDTEGKTGLSYKGFTFSGNTSQKELEALFDKEATPVRISETRELAWILLPFENRDDACHFYFDRGKLKEFEHWTPC